MANHEPLPCPRCSSTFECKVGSIAHCHCSQVRLSSEQKAYIAERWQGCLCHRCLLEVKSTFPDRATTEPTK